MITAGGGEGGHECQADWPAGHRQGREGERRGGGCGQMRAEATQGRGREGGQAGLRAAGARSLCFSPSWRRGGGGGGSWAHPKGVVILAERLCWAPGGTAAGAPFGSCPGRAPSLRLRLVGLQGRQGMLGGAWAQVDHGRPQCVQDTGQPHAGLSATSLGGGGPPSPLQFPQGPFPSWREAAPTLLPTPLSVLVCSELTNSSRLCWSRPPAPPT